MVPRTPGRSMWRPAVERFGGAGDPLRALSCAERLKATFFCHQFFCHRSSPSTARGVPHRDLPACDAAPRPLGVFPRILDVFRSGNTPSSMTAPNSGGNGAKCSVSYIVFFQKKKKQNQLTNPQRRSSAEHCPQEWNAFWSADSWQSRSLSA
jgi:hypothetical protein